jgi:hypothetical protein
LGKTTLADVLGKVHECCDEAPAGSRPVLNHNQLRY